MLAALGVAGDRLARWLCSGFGRLSRGVAAFQLRGGAGGGAGHLDGALRGDAARRRPGLDGRALLLSLCCLRPPRPEAIPAAIPGETDRRTRAEWALVLAAGATLAVLGLKYAFHYRWGAGGLGPDDESYHLAAMAVCTASATCG